MRYPNEDEVKALRMAYPVGCTVELVQMDDTYAPPVGTLGKVRYVDDAGTIHVSWRNGCGLGVTYGQDLCRRVDHDK